jgi:hypothetical protein
MGAPVLAQHPQGSLGQRHIVIFVALAPDVDQHPRTIDIGDLELHPFLQAQPARVNGTQTGLIAGPTQAAQDAMHFFTTENDR